jgi:hypothetical protein
MDLRTRLLYCFPSLFYTIYLSYFRRHTVIFQRLPARLVVSMPRITPSKPPLISAWQCPCLSTFLLKHCENSTGLLYSISDWSWRSGFSALHYKQWVTWEPDVNLVSQLRFPNSRPSTLSLCHLQNSANLLNLDGTCCDSQTYRLHLKWGVSGINLRQKLVSGVLWVVSKSSHVLFWSFDYRYAIRLTISLSCWKRFDVLRAFTQF